MRGGARHAAGYPDERGRLQAECWCGAHLVWVAPSVIQAGRTGTCALRCREGSPYIGAQVGRPRRIA